MEKIIRKINVKLQYIIKALKDINNSHLGDIVLYNNTKCCLIQGVQNPYWDLLPLIKENLSKTKREIYKHIHKDDFKLQPLYKRFNFSFMFTYNFLMKNWYNIDIKQTGNISYS